MEKKNNVSIGILIAIIFLLIGLIFAILIMTKGKENSDNDNKSTSASTQTLKTSKVSETTTIRSMEIEEYEKKLNEKLSSVKSPLEKKYNLQRKIIVGSYETGDYGISIVYLYNGKEVILMEECRSKLGKTNCVTDTDSFEIKELSDSTTNDKYYFIYTVDGIISYLKIYNSEFDSLKEITFPNGGVNYKNDEPVYDNGYNYKLVDSKTLNYIMGSSLEEKVTYHKLTIQKGTIKDTIIKEDAASNYIFFDNKG